MQAVDYALVAIYLIVLLALGVRKRLSSSASAEEMIVGGRALTLPAFVASLVSTWYGGILGVGEYGYLYGLSTWLVFGFPYYLAAFLFALLLARRARRAEVLTIPDQLHKAYGKGTAGLGAGIVFLMTVPAAYILMLGVLIEFLFGYPFWIGIVAGSFLSIVYVYLGGFNAVVRTDLFQFGLMFLGFAVLLGVLVTEHGGLAFIESNLPETHLTWHGGNPGWYIASWYGIALATLIEPAFFQRCYAARNERIARNGIFISIACWTVFDFMTTACGLYAATLLPDLADPVSAFPSLAYEVLPAGLLGLFVLALLATVMSTVDSFSFLSGSTLSNDLLARFGIINSNQISRYTRIGVVVSSALAVLLALFMRSVVDIWHLFGSIGTPALLIPVLVSFIGKPRVSGRVALVSIIVSGSMASLWYLSAELTNDGGYWLGLEPVFPGLITSISVYIFASLKPQGSWQVR